MCYQERLEAILTKRCKTKASEVEQAKSAEIEAEIVSPALPFLFDRVSSLNNRHLVANIRNTHTHTHTHIYTLLHTENLLMGDFGRRRDTHRERW